MHQDRVQALTRKTDAGLQVQRLTLAARTKPTFTLYPMIHVADAAFFTRVMKEADAHDCVLKEGVGSGPVARTTANAYKNISQGSPTLAVQPGSPETPAAVWYNSDLDPDSFRRKWRRVPFVRRMLFHIALRVVGLILRFGKARQLLIDALANTTIDDGKALDSVFGKDFRKVILDDRDAALLKGCEIAIRRRPGDRIAVVWGAAHLPQLTQALIAKHGYRITDREWITVLAADDT